MQVFCTVTFDSPESAAQADLVSMILGLGSDTNSMSCLEFLQTNMMLFTYTICTCYLVSQSNNDVCISICRACTCIMAWLT